MRYIRLSTGEFDDYPHSFYRDDFGRLEGVLIEAEGVVPLKRVVAGAIGVNQVAMRHDVDHNIEHALKFAKWEHKRDFHSTYFILHTIWYYEDKKTTYRCMHEMEEMGHEVGLHHNTVGALAKAGHLTSVDGSVLPAGWCHQAAAWLALEIDTLRKEGFDIRGVAAHGAGVPDVSNVDLWAAGYSPENDFGVYEAYHLHKDAYYVTDNRGRWQGDGGVEGWACLDAYRPKKKQMHISIHPCHWDFTGVV